MKSVLQQNPHSQIVYKRLRNKFKLQKSKLKQQDFNKLIQNLESSSMIEIMILDEIFFQQLFECVKQLQRPKTTLIKMDKFVQMVEIKMVFFQQLIDLYMNLFDRSSRKIGEKNPKAQTYIRFKEPKRFQQFILPNVTKFLDLYNEKSPPNRKLKVSLDIIDAHKVQMDQKLKEFFRQQIEKYLLTNPQISRKNQSQKVQKKIDSDLYFEQKKFIEKVMFKIKEIDARYNVGKENHQNSNSLSFPIESMIKNIEIEEFVPTKCLNCVQFFYKDVQVSDEYNSLVDYELVPCVKSIKKTHQERDQILQHITAFLNQGNGTLLFNCKATAFGFIPVGYEMTLKEQQAYKYSFENLFKYIKIESYQKSIDCEIDFIPLKVNASQNSGKVINDPRQPYVQRDFVKGFYVMRVKLRPRSLRQLFGCEIDFKTYYYVREKRKTKQIGGIQFYKIMRMKTLHFYSKIAYIKKVQDQMGKQIFEEVIKGIQQYRKNLHEGHCKQTLILSATSNSKQTLTHATSTRRYQKQNFRSFQ